MTVITLDDIKVEEVLKKYNLAPDCIVCQIDRNTVIKNLKVGIEYIIDRFPIEKMSKEIIEKFTSTYMSKWLTNGNIEGLRHLSAITFEEVYSGYFRDEIKELFEPDEINYISIFC